MIGRYNLPYDDLLAAYWDTVVITASDEDPAYPVSNWGARKPAKPSKLTTTSGSWEFDFGVPVNAAVVSAIYHNFDPGLDVTWKWNSVSGSWGSPAGFQDLIVPAWPEDQWPLNPWAELESTPTYRYWLLDVGAGSPGNSQPLSLGRPYLGGALRDLTNDVRWGVEEIEEHGVIESATALGVEHIFPDLDMKRRRFVGELALKNDTADTLIGLMRSARMRMYPWLLIPDVDVNDAWFVRFDEPRWSRTRETINHNIFPFRVQELSRGVPWP